MPSQLTTLDELLLRRTIALSATVKASGKHPFAALVADGRGRIIAEAGNDVIPPQGDPTRHAELLAAMLASRQLDPAALAGCTLYASAEPCAMCAGAIYWCNIGRVVYALSERHLLELTQDHPENPTFSLPCRQVFAHGQRQVSVLGPYLEAEAALPHQGFWKR